MKEFLGPGPSPLICGDLLPVWLLYQRIKQCCDILSFRRGGQGGQVRGPGERGRRWRDRIRLGWRL